MSQQPIIIGKLLIIMKAVGTIEEKNIRRRPRNTPGKRMGTPPLHIRIQTNRNSTSVTLCVKAAAASLAAVLRFERLRRHPLPPLIRLVLTRPERPARCTDRGRADVLPSKDAPLQRLPSGS